MKILCVLATYLIVTLYLIVPMYLQNIQSRHYRPLSQKCDRHGRCFPKKEVDQEGGYILKKDRPPELARNDWPIHPMTDDDYNHRKDTNKVDDSKLSVGRPVGGGRHVDDYNSNPAVDDEKISDGRRGSGYNLKVSVGRDDDIKAGGRPNGESDGYAGSGFTQMPEVDRDDYSLKSASRPAGDGSGYEGGGYKPKPPVYNDVYLKVPVRTLGTGRDGYRNGGYKPKPAVNRNDDYLKSFINRPGVSGGGYGSGGYKPKLAVDGDDDPNPPVRRPGVSRSGFEGGNCKSKPDVDRDNGLIPTVNRPVVGGGGYGGGGYKPKPAVNRDNDIKFDVNRSNREGNGYGESYIPRLGENRGGGGRIYYPKTDDDEYIIRRVPVKEGTNYTDGDRKSDNDDLGGYNDPSDNDYNAHGTPSDVKHNDYNRKPVSIVERNCICVPFFQCKDGYVITDGAGLIDSRTMLDRRKRSKKRLRAKLDPEDGLLLHGEFKSLPCGPHHVCCNASTVKPHEHQCGVRNPKGINNGVLAPYSNEGEANFGEWPWQAAVLKSEGKVNIFQCGGVLIDKYHVLTVAHCVFHLDQLNEYPLIVRLGEWDSQSNNEFLAHEDYKVLKIIIHPEFRNTTLWNDIAILKLQVPVLFKPHIDRVCLPEHDETFSGQNCIVTGWGKDLYKGGTFSNVMKEVSLQVIDNDQCEDMLRKTRLGRFFQLHEAFLCAESQYGLDSCKGDGGGPLVCYRYLKGKSYALAGIISWGIDCGHPGVPGVYVKIEKYLDWISKTTGVTLQDYWPKL